MAGLGVNIDHVATLRQARKTDEPDPVWAAVEAELAGADCITFHLREDRRHINDRDARLLKETVATKLNMEMSINAGIVKIACALRPDQATLVPEKRQELTTEGGLDVVKDRRRIRPVVRKLQDAGVLVSAFVEPEAAQIEAAVDCGCDAVELWTAAYAEAKTARQRDKALDQLRGGVALALAHGIDVHGGHGLTYRNIGPVAAVAGFGEFNIGHSIVSRAVLVGMRAAVAEMKALVEKHTPMHYAFLDADAAELTS